MKVTSRFDTFQATVTMQTFTLNGFLQTAIIGTASGWDFTIHLRAAVETSDATKRGSAAISVFLFSHSMLYSTGRLLTGL